MQPPLRGQNDEDEEAGDIDQKMEEYWRRLAGYICRPTSLLVIVLVVFVSTRVWLLVVFKATWPDTAYYYSQYARLAIDGHLIAYRDVKMEYPPLAWWLMAVPRLIDPTTYSDPAAPPEVVKQFFDWYFAWFHAELCLADTICLGLMFAIGRRMLPTAQWVLPAAYTLLTVAQPHLIYDRLDIVLLMFFLLCIECWLRSLEVAPGSNRRAELWGVASYLFLGLGISFKIMPVIFVPFLLLADMRAGGAWRLARRVLALAIGAVGPFLVHVPSAGWDVLLLFRYHSGRGIHLESIWGSIMLLAAAFGVPCEVVFTQAAYNLTGSLSGALKLLSSASLFAMGASLGLWALLGGKRFDRRLALDAAMLALVNSTVLANVISPQYLNWLLPLAILLAVSTFPRNWIVWCGFAALVVGTVGISSWLYPYHYVPLTKLETLPVVVAVTRNACLVGMAGLLTVCFFGRYGLVPWRTGKPATGALATAA